MRLGEEFEGYRRVVRGDIKGMKQCREDLYEVNMGATGVGRGVNGDGKYIGEVVGYVAEIRGLGLVGGEDLVDGR
ncbi:lyase family protein, partial [Bacillus altitudinis]|uniref:lyase family protein n=1 Tax=Bacillus altitudinis TaxID=293387 RepID=UPI002356EF39